MGKNKSHITENWMDLASLLQDKTMHRMGDINMLISRAGIIIAGIAVLTDCLLTQNLSTVPFLLVAALILASLILTIASLFIQVEAPINPDDAIRMLGSKEFHNMSRTNFSKWKAESFRKSLKSINAEYDKHRRLQILSFVFFAIAILVLFISKYVNIDIIINLNL